MDIVISNKNIPLDSTQPSGLELLLFLTNMEDNWIQCFLCKKQFISCYKW